MNWLNIHTSTLRTPEFISSEPVERATWLCVLSYSAEQENGGRLLGAAHWTDRQWQQTCGVTRLEVREAVKLLRIDGDDVLVAFYPDDKEKEVRARRLNGRNGGLRSGAARSKLSSKQKGSTPSSALLQRKGMRKKRKGIARTSLSCLRQEEFLQKPIPRIGPQPPWAQSPGLRSLKPREKKPTFPKPRKVRPAAVRAPPACLSPGRGSSPVGKKAPMAIRSHRSGG